MTRLAFNAFISTTVIVGQISFALPALLLVLRRRAPHYLPPKRDFKIPSAIGYMANLVCIAWAVVMTVFFTFPSSFPVTGGNMSMLFLFFLPPFLSLSLSLFFFFFPSVCFLLVRCVLIVWCGGRLCIGGAGGYVGVGDWELVFVC